MKPKALDLFCKAGGATKGLQRAGFYVVGVDIEPQPHYCGDEFIQADAFEVTLDGYDFIWASPKCQKHSLYSRNTGRAHLYEDQITPIRPRLKSTGTPFAIENVPGSPLRIDLVLCGSMFGLKVQRHRWFEIDGLPLILAPAHKHDYQSIGVYGHGTPGWHQEKLGRCIPVSEMREAMGIDWMTRAELSQAVPPAYSEYIGKFAIQVLEVASVA